MVRRMLTKRAFILLSIGPMVLGDAASAAASLQPLPEGTYCLKQPFVKDWEPGPPQSDTFRMRLQIGREADQYRMSFWNVQPFAGPILEGASDRAVLLADGSLVFRFVDGWDNEGRATIRRNGKVVLTKIKVSTRADAYVSDGNYGSFRLAQSTCADDDFKDRH